MAKKIVRLTENELYNIIAESVNRILIEMEDNKEEETPKPKKKKKSSKITRASVIKDLAKMSGLSKDEIKGSFGW